MTLLRNIIIIFFATTLSESANILYVMPFTAKSHYIGLKELALELARRGHNVYSITPYKEDVHPSTYYQIKTDSISIWDKLFDERPNIFSMTDYSFTTFQQLLYKSGFMVNDLVFNSTEVQKFMKENHKIDVVISELLFNEALYMFAHKYQAPLVLVTTFGNSVKGNYFSRNPLQLSTLYHEYGKATEPLSFIGRLQNLYYCVCDILMIKFWYLPRQQKIAELYFDDLPKPVPSLEALAANASLVLMNSHFSVDTSVAYLPNFIEVGGLHIKDSDKITLSNDLEKILDNAKNGVVFMSFGSNVHSSELGKDKLNAFLKVFGELKQTVLMKWENTTLPNVPKNVVLRKWFPQREVLAHPNIKLFIGHGGLLGLQETITAGVPILGIPVYGDQYINILQVTQNGHGELLEHKDINEERLRATVNKILNDKSYLQKARQVSARFKDRPMSAMDTAVWWIEYILRHEGAEFMKSPALNMNYIAYQNLDIFAFLTTIVIAITYLVWKFINFLLSSNKPVKKQKKH